MAYNPYLMNPYMQPSYLPAYQPQQQAPFLASVQPQGAAQPQQTTNSQSNMIWVNSEAEARSYPVAPGNAVILMDNDHPIAYKKSADLSGRALPLEIYDLVKRDEKEQQKEEPHQITLDEYLTKKEFNEYAAKIEKRLPRQKNEIIEVWEEDIVEEKPVRRVRRSSNE